MPGREDGLSLERWKSLAREGEAPSGVCLHKRYDSQVKQVPGEERTVEITISTGSVDRDNDVLVPDGAVLENYRKNPVVLWGHEWWSLPIARAEDIRVEGDSIVARDRFPTREEAGVGEGESFFAGSVYSMLVNGYLNAASVGFDPKEHKFVEDRGGFTFLEWELLEHSIVPIPANADALMAASADGIDVEPILGWAKGVLERWDGDAGDLPRTVKDAGGREVIHVPADDDTETRSDEPDRYMVRVPRDMDAEHMDRIRDDLKAEYGVAVVVVPGQATVHNFDGVVIDWVGEAGYGGRADGPTRAKTVVEYQDLALEGRDREWDVDEAEARVRSWAGGGEDLDEMDWEAYRRAFVWFDTEAPEDVGSYKLPIADVVDGELRAVPRAIFAASAVVQGARGGVDIPDDDMPGVRSHLESYYGKMRDAFDDEEIVAPWNDDGEEEASGEPAASKDEALDALLDDFGLDPEDVAARGDDEADADELVETMRSMSPEQMRDLLEPYIEEGAESARRRAAGRLD